MWNTVSFESKRLPKQTVIACQHKKTGNARSRKSAWNMRVMKECCWHDFVRLLETYTVWHCIRCLHLQLLTSTCKWRQLPGKGSPAPVFSCLQLVIWLCHSFFSRSSVKWERDKRCYLNGLLRIGDAKLLTVVHALLRKNKRSCLNKEWMRVQGVDDFRFVTGCLKDFS